MHRQGSQNTRNVSTTQRLGDVAREYLSDLERRMQGRPLEVLEVWPEVAGELARMTRAHKFDQGVLYIAVGNSTLLSVLHQKKASFLAALRTKVPEAQIFDIVFRMG